MAPPASTRISARLKRVQEHSSPQGEYAPRGVLLGLRLILSPAAGQPEYRAGAVAAKDGCHGRNDPCDPPNLVSIIYSRLIPSNLFLCVWVARFQGFVYKTYS